MPDYEVVQWDERNYKYYQHPFAKLAYERRQWAFVSDIARLEVLHRHGGIYLDTDVVAIRRLDDFLHHQLFLGMMFSDSLGTAVIGAEAGNRHIADILEGYRGRMPGVEPNNDVFTGYFIDTAPGEFLLANLYQELPGGVAIYPKEYFERPTRDPRAGYTEHLVFGSWNGANGKTSRLAGFGRSILGRANWGRLQNLRTIPRAKYFGRFVTDFPKSCLRRLQKTGRKSKATRW